MDIKGNVQFSDGTNAAILETGSQSTYGAGSWIQSNHGPTAGGFFGMFDVNGGEMAFDYLEVSLDVNFEVSLEVPLEVSLEVFLKFS